MHIRILNGHSQIIETRDALAEINHAMMDGKDSVLEMSASRSTASITYVDGRKVVLRPATREEIEAPPTPEPGQNVWTGEATRIVIVKGKRYVVGTITPAGDRGTYRILKAYVSYWSERNGETFGATRSASDDAKPGTVGRAIWDAVNR